jgi:hypothetical protein
MERSFLPGTPTRLEFPGPRAPNQVLFEDDGEAGSFYAIDLSRPEEFRVVDCLAVYVVETLPLPPKPHFVRIQWSPDGAKVALFVNGRAHAVFDFDHQRGYSRTNSPMPGNSPWPKAEQLWDDRALSGIG